MSSPEPAPSFPCRVVVAIQWGDVDMLQHVNNVVFFRWLETARTTYFSAVGLEKLLGDGVYPILASIRCDFRSQLRHPGSISVECSTSRIGRSSSTQVYRVLDAESGRLAAEAEGTWVCFDYRAQKAKPLPDEVVAALERYEGRTFR